MSTSSPVVASLNSQSGSVSLLFSGAVTRYILLAVNIGIGVFLMPFTVRHLGPAEYGLWMMVASMTYYFQLLDLGYGSGILKQITAADAQGDVEGVNRVLSTFVVVYGTLGLAAAVGVGALIVFALPRFPHLTPGDLRTAQTLLAIIGVRIVVGFPMGVFGAVTSARQRFALNNTVAIALALLNGVITYVVLASGHGLVTLVASTTALSLAGYGGYAFTATRAFPQLSIRLRLFSKNIVREVTAFSIYFFLIDIAVQIGFNLDNVVIGGFLGTAAVAVYAITLRLADYQRQLCNQVNSLLFPVVVRFGSIGQREGLRRTLIEGTRIALVLVVGVTVCLVGFGGPLISTWMGPGFEGSVAPLVVLALTGVVLVGQGPLGTVLVGTGRHRFVALVALSEALVNLALSLVLVRRFGIMGVALGTGIPVFVANLFVQMPVACRTVGISVRQFGRDVLRAPMVGLGPAILACLAFRSLLPPTTILAVVGEGAVVGAIYMATALTLGFPSGDRSRYLEHARVFLARYRPAVSAPEAS